MSHFSNHSDFYNSFILLSENEKQNPLNVLARFTEDYKLSELREILFDINYACLISDLPPYDDPGARADLVLHNRRLEELFEALFLFIVIRK